MRQTCNSPLLSSRRAVVVACEPGRDRSQSTLDRLPPLMGLDCERLASSKDSLQLVTNNDIIALSPASNIAPAATKYNMLMIESEIVPAK
jgi:hypothetical protein